MRPDFAWSCHGTDPGGDVYGQTTQLLASHLAFTGVQPQVQVDAKPSCGFRNSKCTTDGASGAVEGSQEPVAGGLDLVPSKPPQVALHCAVMGVEQRVPGLVPH